MAFALQLQDSLRLRESQVPSEFASGDALGVILTRYLLAVEEEADNFILTSILLLDGQSLRKGAAPTLPEAYCAAIDGAEIGPCAGSCGTAAFLGRPVYVTDIATDPLWADYKDLALPHGLRACWSTPIFDDNQAVIGTFAIYHLASTGPTEDEIAAIRTITDHVARAIMWSRSAQDMFREHAAGAPPRPALKLAADRDSAL
jgi:GAF domain-containing protein